MMGTGIRTGKKPGRAMEAEMGKNKVKRGKPEILAPAGSVEGLRAAIGAGADAVYMGGVRFGARAYANNPGQDELCAAIDYAHLYGRRIYLTVNTLLKPGEMEELYHYIKPYYEQGVDAVIVQDVGVLKYIADEFPGLNVHASTQMSLTMAEGAKCFAGYPVTRLVNAREVGLCEIRRIREGCGLEIESFVHGALCYCYSGQCLMSSMIGDRSGNRGRCAQPCRLEYGGGYLLSPKDICTLDMIPELIEAGIDSFKIEGRMKRYEYAAGVTAAYRREVDRYFYLGGEGYRAFHEKNPQVLKQELLDLQDLYNRGGFTKGYYRQQNGREMMSFSRPNHSGVAVAQVEKVWGNHAILRCKEELRAQDVLEIRMGGEDHPRGVCGGEAYEFTLGQGHPAGDCFETKFTPGLPIKKGNPVYRTKNSWLLGRISDEYFVKEPKIAVYGEFYAEAGRAAGLLVGTVPQQPDAGQEAGETADGEGRPEGPPRQGELSVHVQGDTVQRAEKQPMGEERLRAALEKTGDTPFYFSELKIQTFGDVFLPVSALNALRRNALSQLEAEIVGRFRRTVPKKTDSTKTGYLPQKDAEKDAEKDVPAKEVPAKNSQVHVTVMTEEQFGAALLVARVARIYYDIAALGEEGVLGAAGRAKAAGKEFFLRLPRICRAKAYDFLKAQEDRLLGEWVDGYLIQNYEQLFLFAKEWHVQDQGKCIVADAMLYTMNAQAKQFFRGLGVTEFTAPYEENQKELSLLGLSDTALVVYGRLPLMVSAQCVYKNTKGCLQENGQGEGMHACLTDRKGKKLPVFAACRFCYNVIYGSESLALFGCAGMDKLSPRAIRYDLTDETGQEAALVLGQDLLPEGREKTLGHFRRGVL